MREVKTKATVHPKARTAAKPMKKSRAAIILSVLSVVLLALTAVGLFLSRHFLADPVRVREAVGNHYFLGGLVTILLCAVQVVVALIPGEMLEIAAGYVFGAWWGALLCTVGVALGSVSTILLVRRFGRKFVYAIYPKEKMDALPVLKDPRKRNSLVLILFLIPGTPKDLLTYGIGLTDMRIPLYLLLTTAARFPSVISSTMGGNAMGEKEYTSAIIIFAVTVTISLIGLTIYNFISKKHGKAGKANSCEAPSGHAEEDMPRADSHCLPEVPSDPTAPGETENGNPEPHSSGKEL